MNRDNWCLVTLSILIFKPCEFLIGSGRGVGGVTCPSFFQAQRINNVAYGEHIKTQQTQSKTFIAMPRIPETNEA